jgi:predicted unusual protein kinase regulating ubiquinone biosynthesis (AarF/ABC1/UbiB family)
MLDPDFHYLEYAGPIIRKNWRRAHSPTSVATRAVRAAAEAIDLGAGLPRRVARLLGRVERGDIRLNVDHTGLEHVTREFQRMTNRLALAIILGASVIALGIAAGIRLVPALEPIIGWLFRLGLVFSLALGASVLWGMWRAERR